MDSPDKILKAHFQIVRETLLEKANEAGLASSTSIRGAARELVLSEFFQANLAESVAFRTGEIIDVKGQRSGQIDILVVPTGVPRFSLGGTNVIALAAGVVGAIEVKSNLTTSGPEGDSELSTALNSCVRVKQLDPGPLVPWPWTVQRTDGADTKLETIPYSVVAYRGPAPPTLIAHLKEWGSKVQTRLLPNTFTVLEEDYTLSLNDGWSIDPAKLPDPSTLYLISEPESSLAHLFDFWMKCVQAWTFNFPYTPLNRYLRLGFRLA